MITTESIARFSAALSGVIGKDCARDVAAIAAHIMRAVEDDATSPIHLGALAEAMSCDRKDVLARLRLADGCFAAAVGTSIIEDPTAYDLDTPFMDLALDLSPGFVHMLRGIVADSCPDPRPVIWPDAGSLQDLQLLRSAVSTGAQGAFLYKMNGEDLTEEVGYLSRAYSESAPEHVVKICDGPQWARGGMVSNLLSVLLHCVRADLLIVVGRNLITSQKQDEAFDDDEFHVIRSSKSEPTLFTSEGERLLQLLPHVPATIVVPIPSSARLRPRDAQLFVGAVGPIKPDRKAMIERVQTTDPRINDQNAALLVQLWRDPDAARHNLARLHLMAGDNYEAQPNQVAASSDARKACRALSHAPEEFNPLLRRCVGGMFPLVHGRTAPSQRADLFFRELFVARPNPSILWDHGAKLASSAAIIGMFGIPGTGKTAAARAAIAGGMHLDVLERRGSDLQHRYFGQTEKAIKNAFAQARAENACLLFDEAESIVAARSEFTGNTAHSVTAMTTQFLQELDDHTLPVMFVSNYPDRIDPAVIRRIDISIEVLGLPDHLEVRAWELLIGVDPPCGWSPMGDLTTSDFMHAVKLARLTDDWTANSIATNIRSARDARCGNRRRMAGIGFLADMS